MRNLLLIGTLCVSGLLWAPKAQAQDGMMTASASVPNVHVVNKGDTLWDITNRYYRNPYEWPRVWSYNPEVTNPHWIYPGSSIRLVGASGEAPAIEERMAEESTRSAEKIYLRDIGFLDKNALKRSGKIVAGRDNHMLLSIYDKVYVKFGEGVTPQPGTDYTVYRHIKKKERRKKEKGSLVRIMGSIRLESFDAERRVGTGRVLEAREPIERGYLLSPMLRAIDPVSPIVSDRDIDTEVIGSIFPRKLLAQHQVVFVDVGSEDGVLRGHRFFFLREGDEWRDATRGTHMDLSNTVKLPKEPKDYPPAIVAQGRVVSVRPNTAAVLLTDSIRALDLGDEGVMRKGR